MSMVRRLGDVLSYGEPMGFDDFSAAIDAMNDAIVEEEEENVEDNEEALILLDVICWHSTEKE